MQRCHVLYRNPHQDCLSSSSDGQIKQDLAKRYHQLCNQLQAVQVFADSEKRIRSFESTCVTVVAEQFVITKKLAQNTKKTKQNKTKTIKPKYYVPATL